MIRPIAISLIALAYTFTAAPAFAKTNKSSMEQKSHAGAKTQKAKMKPSHKATRRISARGAYARGVYARGGGAYARVGSRYSANPAYDVYLNGNYVGSDPDPRIRYTIQQESKDSFNASR